MPFHRALWRRLIASCVAAFSIGAVQAAELKVTLEGIDRPLGSVLVALYDDARSFRASSLLKERMRAQAGRMEFVFRDLRPGEYAVLAFHDLNDNGELDTNALGLPKEPWGATRNGKRIFGPPEWEHSHIQVPSTGASLTITVE